MHGVASSHAPVASRGSREAAVCQFTAASDSWKLRMLLEKLPLTSSTKLAAATKPNARRKSSLMMRGTDEQRGEKTIEEPVSLEIKRL